MAVEPAGHGRGEIHLQPQLRGRLSLVPTDSPEPDGRAQLGPDGVPDAASRWLTAYQSFGRAREPGAGGNHRQVACESPGTGYGACAVAGLSAATRGRDPRRGNRIRAAACADLGA